MMHRWWAAVVAWLRRGRPPKPLGARGEEAAARYLRRLGYQVVARDARSRYGEIDLVAVDGRTIVFVEVKTRESADTGHPTEAVDAVKRRRVSRAATAFLKSHGLLESPARFDVVAVTWPPGQRRPTIEHFPHAFEASEPREFVS